MSSAGEASAGLGREGAGNEEVWGQVISFLYICIFFYFGLHYHIYVWVVIFFLFFINLFISLYNFSFN